MKRTVIDCDGCLAENINPVTVTLTVGRSSCPAGGPSEEDNVDLELCEKCAAWAFHQVSAEIDYTRSTNLINLIKSRKSNLVRQRGQS